MNYSIIKDEEKLRSFIDWLPELGQNETYYVALLARNKYIRDLGIGTFNSDKHQCKRFLSTKDRLFEKIKQLECEEGSYVVKGIQVPQEALALYITPNPRNFAKATQNSLVKFAEVIASGNYNNFNPMQEALSQVHKSLGKKHYLDLDFDGVSLVETNEKIKQFINVDAITYLITRGGFHALIHLASVDKKYEKTWYKNISTLTGLDIKGDNMIPVPGCTQGNFVPFFV